MNTIEQTTQQIERFIHKIGQKFPACDECDIVTDIHVCANQDTGELLAYDDNENEITRCVIEQWIGNTDDNFYDRITLQLRKIFKREAEIVDHLGILKPYSFVLESDERMPIAELYLADDDTVIIDGDLMPGLDKDFDDFLSKLMQE
ncbi:hypothetical protein [Segatella maculosa]|jgi:hypothetical protein|uniref:hypothetical protein n=1 Tax=Segatella maculosa TaxID=439703 RepID=UPI0003809068|nr:hypothetical protein [Segatella maculosa]